MTKGLAWLVTEAVAEGEVVVLVGMVDIPDKKRIRTEKGDMSCGNLLPTVERRGYPKSREPACLTQSGNKLSRKGHHD
jgi:hypothetical protein